MANQKWCIRVFASVLGMIFTDCYNAHMWERKIHHHAVTKGTRTHHSLLDKLVYSLIHNAFVEQPIGMHHHHGEDEYDEVTR